ncbi:O-antigen ligase family protein [Telmatospirillum siberiense]|uniref:O-antigen ligase-related domain-containing protein n=1 Tax=Telmatospirillum siberiense TaxID=382514 RepID=A0A2N3PVM1_9PROT|nr:O-antigen ligase family protein [Telmatospirillum siberiense]PKU24453.1 hypothetical protein CWS72_11435 [Telmatospirillum siberiense]
MRDTAAENDTTPLGSQLRLPRRENAAQAERMIFIGISAVIVLAPLPLGSGRPLAWDILGLCVATLLMGSLGYWPRKLGIFSRDLTPPALAFGLVICVVIVQISTMVPTVWDNPLWDQASETLGKHVAGTIAVDRQAALSGLLRLLTYAGVFFLTFLFGRDRDRASTSIKVVAFSGGAYAAYGLLAYWSGNETVLWLSKWAYMEDLTGTFVNRNSFATFLGLCLLAALSHLVKSFSRLRLYGTSRDKAHLIIEYLGGQSWLILSLFSLATALVLTHSRGGFLSSLVAALTFFVMLSQAPSLGRFRNMGLVALPVVLVVLAFLISGGTTLGRLMETTLGNEERLTVYQLTWQVIQDYPVLGIGLGSFTSFFPLYRTEAVTSFFDLTHNDYLQNILELGVPAAASLFFAILWLVGLCVRGMRTRQRDGVYPCLGIAASILVALHASVDFSLQIPAVTTTYMALLGVAVAQSRSSQEGAENKPRE